MMIYIPVAVLQSDRADLADVINFGRINRDIIPA